MAPRIDNPLPTPIVLTPFQEEEETHDALLDEEETPVMRREVARVVQETLRRTSVLSQTDSIISQEFNFLRQASDSSIDSDS